ncbi:MAG: hypothetical protein MUC42_11865, partial [Bryobacter sp.]|nr:hypothetical protein [Bryobacter sp.]
MEHPESDAKVAGREVQDQVEKILASRSFGASETMRHLLSYLAEHTVKSPDHPPKEHEIAVELLGRPEAFDPKLDPVVRVQTSRLRSKLAEYYVAEGAGDAVFLEVPKGAYCLQASYRGSGKVPEVEVRAPMAGRSASWAAWAMAAIAVAVGTSLALWFYWPRGDEGLRRFWRPFLASKAESLLVYANPKFVGSSSTGLRIFDPAKDHAEQVNPGYTGIGEVTGAAEAARIFTMFHAPLRLKRSQLFAWDDAKAYNLIFLGAPPHNVSLFQVPLGRKLKIKPYGDSPFQNQGCIQNLSVRKGEEEYYCQSSEGPTSVEYALVTMSPGVDQSKPVLVVAGTTTFGTQAAMEFICDSERIDAVNRAL